MIALIRLVPVDLIPVVLVGIAAAVILFLTLRAAYYSRPVQKKFAARTHEPESYLMPGPAVEMANLVSFPVEEEVVDELTLADETVLSRLANLGKRYNPRDLVQIAQDVFDRDGMLTEDESEAYLYRLLEKGDVFTPEQYGVMHSIASTASELEQYVGFRATRSSVQ